MNLSEHFTLEEFEKSDYALRRGIPNKATPATVENMQALCGVVMERVRAEFGNPIKINSGYRSPKVNKGIGGAATSQHLTGEAADFEVIGVRHHDVVKRISQTAIPFDQLIYEGGEDGWVHVSHKRYGTQRRQVLTAVFVNGKAVYSAFT
jgi:hypothetical protein